MTRRMFLAVPSDPLVPEGPGITFLPDGLMVDLSADMRCGTCKWWRPMTSRYGSCAMLPLDGTVAADFACVKWEPTKSE